MKERFDLIKALTYLKEGKKVRRVVSDEKEFLKINKYGGIVNKKGEEVIFAIYPYDLVEDNWEFYEGPEYEEPKLILNTEEKAYLEGVIRPFKDEITYVTKRRYLDIKKECIDIVADRKFSISLPFFPLETMYKGMEVEKRYKLKELDLFKEGK